MKFDFQQVINQYKSSWNYLKNGGYKEVYTLVFGMPQYPFWFIIQAIWCGFVIRRSYRETVTTFQRKVIQVLISLIMIFSSRELLALLLHKASPITHYPAQAGIASAITILIQWSPFDLVYKILNLLYYFIGMLQGFNQARLFTLVLRNTKAMPVYQSLGISILMTVFEYAFEIITRKMFSGKETKMSKGSTIFRTTLFCVVFFLATHVTPLTKYIGYYQVQLPALALAFALGAFNSAAVVNPSK